MTEKQDYPSLSVNSQYIKDFSFENPFAPSSLTSNDSEPIVNISLDSKINKLESDEDVFEVEIFVNIEVKRKLDSQEEERLMFRLELVYGGIFSLKNFDEDQRMVVLSTYCPSLLFPYVRKIISDITQDAGFQPLLMEPIDFGALYHKKIMQNNQKKDEDIEN